MTPSATEILEQAVRRYAQCASYRDTGEVVAELITGARPHQRRVERKSFSTLFVRPELFRFEFRSAAAGPEVDRTRGVVWTTGSTVSSWQTEEPASQISSSIVEALSGPIGWPVEAGMPVSWLLIPSASKQLRLPVPENATVHGTEVIEGVECFRISGPIPRGRTINVWLDASSHLVRKVKMETLHSQALRNKINERILGEPRLNDEQRAAFLVDDNSGTARTTTYVAETDIPIPHEAFEFTPPG